MDQLSNDIILVIFSKLPARTVLGLRCVCKLWSQIIEDRSNGQYLTEIMNSNEEHKIIILPEISTSNDMFSEYNSSYIYVVENSCNGILCFASRLDKKAYLVNPFWTHQVAEIPPPNPVSQSHDMLWSYGFGFDSATKLYKLVCIFHGIQDYDDIDLGFNNFEQGPAVIKININGMRAELYTLGSSSSSWRSLSVTDPLISNHVVNGTSTYASGVLYWLGTSKSIDSIDQYHVRMEDYHKIISFHLGKEEFRIVSWPNDTNFLCFELVDIGGFLGIADYSSHTHIEIWSLEDHDMENWVRKYKFQRAGIFSEYPYNYVIKFIGPWENGEVLIYDQGLISYNPKTNTLRHIEIPWLQHNAQYFSYKPSLVSLSWF